MILHCLPSRPRLPGEVLDVAAVAGLLKLKPPVPSPELSAGLLAFVAPNAKDCPVDTLFSVAPPPNVNTGTAAVGFSSGLLLLPLVPNAKPPDAGGAAEVAPNWNPPVDTAGLSVLAGAPNTDFDSLGLLTPKSAGESFGVASAGLAENWNKGAGVVSFFS